MDLKLNDDELNSCVQCGLCLPHCPTYRITGDEALSPRGRIHLMREVQLNNAPLTPEVLSSFNTCVQCRGCEPACPSGVPYGHLMERTRETLADAGMMTPKLQRLAMMPLAYPQVLTAGSKAISDCSEAQTGTQTTRTEYRRALAPGTADELGHRRADVHRLCDGRMATRHSPSGAERARGGRFRRHANR